MNELKNIFPPGGEETLVGSGNTMASFTAAAPSDKQPHSSTHIGVLVRWSHWSLALLKCLYDSKQERTNPVILLMKCWVWPAQKNVLFRLPWYSMYIRHWPLTGQEESEPEKLETGNLQDLQVLPCWLTENLLSPMGAAFIGCCFKLICNK